MKSVALFILLCSALYSCGGSASGDASDPFIGQWTFYQITVNHPNSAMYAISPASCFGVIDVKADGTYSLWNTCKRAMEGSQIYEVAAGPWWRVSRNHYRANDSYDIIVDGSGNQAIFANMKVYGNSQGHYESGFMFKGVTITADEMKW